MRYFVDVCLVLKEGEEYIQSYFETTGEYLWLQLIWMYFHFWCRKDSEQIYQ